MKLFFLLLSMFIFLFLQRGHLCMRYSQRIRLLMTNFEQHETRLFELQHAMKIEHNALALALLKREYDEQMYLAQRYARMIVEVEEQRIRRLVERKN